DRAADDVLEIDVGARRDLAGDDREAGGDERLARDAAHRILREDGVENRIGNLIGDLVGVSLGDRLRGEEVPSLTAHAGPAPSVRRRRSHVSGVSSRVIRLGVADQAREWKRAYTVRGRALRALV